MTDTNAVSDYIEFLRQRSGVSHIVSAPPGSTTSTLALTQRCLASGIAFPVPLPDGSVAINIEGDVPPALAALDLVIDPVAAADAPVSDNDAMAVEEEQSVSEVSFEAASDSEEMVAEPELMVNEARSETVEEPPMSDDAFATEPDALADDGDEPATESGEADDALVEPNSGGDDTAVADVDAGGDEAPMFVDASSEDAIESVVDASDPAEMSEDVEESLDGVTEGSLTDDGTDAEPFGDDSAFAESPDAEVIETSNISDDAADAPSDSAAHPEGTANLDAFLAQLEDRFAALENGQAELALRIDAFSSELGEVASRPVPRPDVTEFNRGMARVTTALAQSFRRIEDTVGDLAQSKGPAGSTELAEALSKGFSGLAEAVRAAQKGQGGSAAELEMISTMQQTLSHQLAKLLEASQSSRAPMMEEFLMDIRHATAELLAEQTRVAKTG